MSSGRKAGGRRGAGWLAILAVLTLLLWPVLAGRAHAAMGSPAQAGMAAMGGMKGTVPCHRDGPGPCSTACALGAQLLPAQACAAQPPVGTAGLVAYALLSFHVRDIIPERSTPPPR